MSATYCHIPSNVTITGCAVALFRGVDEIMVCEENRVVLSYQEQQALNSKQPYMLPSPTTLDHYGNPIPSTRLGRLLHKRMNKRKKMDDIEIKDEEALALVSQAQLNHARFAMQGRYFRHVVLRERTKKGETHSATCSRLLKEEFYRKFTGSVPQWDFVYQRKVATKGRNSAILVYMIHVDDTEIDRTVLRMKGKSNYFCAKDLPDICSNDYNETRKHRFVSMKKARSMLEDFSNKYPVNVYDTSHWGALELFNAVMVHSEERKQSPSFQMIEQIGRGAYSIVWRAKRRKGGKSGQTGQSGQSGQSGTANDGGDGGDGHDAEEIAVKELLMRNVPSKRVERVLSEIAAMQSLRGDQNIVELFDAEQHGDSLLLAMTLCDGGTLRDYINTQTPMSNHIELLKIVREITSGLRALRLHDLVRVVVVVVPWCSWCTRLFLLLFSVFVFCILYLFSVFVSY